MTDKQPNQQTDAECSDSNLSRDDFKAIRFCGRGGQGIVTAGELLALAAFEEQKYAQAIPNFGAERRGGPAFCSLRIGSSPILLKCSVTNPDVIAMFDPTIWHYRNMFSGLKNSGIMVFNTQKTGEEIYSELKDKKYGFGPPVDDYEIYTIDATSLALEILNQPIVNTALMGAFSKATDYVSIESVKKVIDGHMKRKVTENKNVAEQAYNSVKKFKI